MNTSYDFADNPYDDSWGDEEPWVPEPSVDDVDVPIIDVNSYRAVQRKLTKLKPSDFTSRVFMMPSTKEGVIYENFSFEGRRHLLRIYNTPAQRLLLFCARQVEKCVSQTATGSECVYAASGMPIQAFDVEVGQRVLSWDEDKRKVCSARVVDKREVGSKPCLLLKTRQGHELRVANTHPVLTARGWVEAKEMTVGTRVGAIRRGGIFGSRDPHLRSVDELIAGLSDVGLYAQDKSIPEEVFNYTRERTALFLNRLWACDGSVGHPTKTKYDIEYTSISLKLVRQVQALLWKFGIPTSFRRYKPKAYEDTEKWSYRVRVETRVGIRQFLTEIGAFGKSEGVDLPDENVPVESLLDSDLCWDKVEHIEELGEEPCFDIEVERTHNFLLNGVFTHNSTTLGNVSLCRMCLIPSFKVLYVSPSATQTKTFSNDRIKDPIETSPILKKYTTRMLSQNILEKQLINRSKITLRYAFLNADRARGIPADMLECDELQDILRDNIPVLEQCLSHADPRRKSYLYSGTPKSLDNVIEEYRANKSTQGEWAVPCEGCNHWNLLGEKNIGKTGPICEKCGKGIDPQGPRAQWVTMVKYDPVKTPFESYRIPQLMVPWRLEDWQDILYQYETYSRAKFYNEVLGISYESGLRPLCSADVMACCDENYSMLDLEKKRHMSLGQPFFAGVDWGPGDNSYTVLTIGTYIDNKFAVLFMHRFIGEESDPHIQIKRIIEICDRFNVQLIGCDYGYGFGLNDTLVKKYGPQRVHKYQYLGQLKGKIQFDNRLMRWKVNRTEVMSGIFSAIKKGKCRFPRWEEFQKPYAQDFLNIYSEYNDALRMIQYDHLEGSPDDSFHSFVYCWLASMIMVPRPDILAPTKEDPSTGMPVSDYHPLNQG